MPKSYFCKKSALKKILITRFSSIGDIVLTTPVVRCIKQQVPGAEVHFAVKKTFYPIIQANPYIDKFQLLEGELRNYSKMLQEENFDFIVDLHKSLRSRYIRRSLKVPFSGFPKKNLQKWLLVKFKIDLMPDLHIVDRYFRAAARLGVTNDGKGLDYFIPEKDEYDLAMLPEAFHDGYTAFAIGARHATKRLPEHKIISVCHKLASPVILLGGPEDSGVAKNVAAACGPLVCSLCGSINLNQSASLVRQAKAVISHDTGMMHIAAAFRKRIISIWGNTVPEFGMFPYMPGDESKSSIIEVEGLSCRPCSKLGYDRCPKKHFKCMEEMDVDVIVKEAESE